MRPRGRIGSIGVFAAAQVTELELELSEVGSWFVDELEVELLLCRRRQAAPIRNCGGDDECELGGDDEERLHDCSRDAAGV